MIEFIEEQICEGYFELAGYCGELKFTYYDVMLCDGEKGFPMFLN